MSASYKGYTLGKVKNVYRDPEGYAFRIGHKQTDGTVNIYYISKKRDLEVGQDKCPSLPESLVSEIYMNLVEVPEKKNEEAFKQFKKAENFHNMYKPGGLGYLFLKSKVTKERKFKKEL